MSTVQSFSLEGATVSVASEAIVVVDIVESTGTTNRFGWYAVGGEFMRYLRQLVTTIGNTHGLQCIKSTGDGYLLTYGDPNSQAAEIGVVKALEASFESLNLLKDRNQMVREEQAINVRFAIHFGEVVVVEGDREGPYVTYTFRLIGITQKEIKSAIESKSVRDLMPPKAFPPKNYVLCSEEVKNIIEKRCPKLWTFQQVGLFKLRGFIAWHEVYLVSSIQPQPKP